MYALDKKGHKMLPEYIVHDPNKGDVTKRRYTVVIQYIGSTEADENGNTKGAGPYVVGWAVTRPGDFYKDKEGVRIARERCKDANRNEDLEYYTVVEHKHELFEDYERIIRQINKVRAKRYCREKEMHNAKLKSLIERLTDEQFFVGEIHVRSDSPLTDFHREQLPSVFPKVDYKNKGTIGQQVKEWKDSNPESDDDKNKVPVFRGCQQTRNGGACFCSGACKAIVGYRDKLPGEF